MTVNATVIRPGANINLSLEIVLVGQVAPTGLFLELSATELECGETLVATATAVDENNIFVSDGTVVYFTTDTSSAIINGKEGAQGSSATKDGVASASIAMSPDDPGTHSVIAYIKDAAGRVLAQVSETLNCTSATAGVAPTPPPPPSGGGSITPPSTGDAGLAGASSNYSVWTFAAAAVVLAATVLGILVGGYAGKFDYNGKRR